MTAPLKPNESPDGLAGQSLGSALGSASGCTLKDPELMQCCCNCIYLRAVHYHCCTTPKPEGVTGCVCGVQKGWACTMPEHNRIYDNWPQHSYGCELYTARTPNSVSPASFRQRIANETTTKIQIQ